MTDPGVKAQMTMRLKFLLSVALLLNMLLINSTHAAIVYPSAPDGGAQVAAKYLDPMLLKPFGVTNVGSLTIAAPIPDYYGDFVSGKFLSGAPFGSWRYPLMQGTNCMGFVYLAQDGTNKLKFNSFSRPFSANDWLNALRLAKDWPQTKTQDLEIRFVGNPEVSFMAIWLHGKSDDILIPLPQTYGRMNAYQPYSESEITKILAPEAKRDSVMWAKMFKQRNEDNAAYAKAMTDYEKAQ